MPLFCMISAFAEYLIVRGNLLPGLVDDLCKSGDISFYGISGPDEPYI